MLKSTKFAVLILPFIIGLAFPLLAAKSTTFQPSTHDLPPEINLSTPTPKGVNAIDNLIALTEENLKEQKKLQTLLKEYQKIEGEYLNNPDDQKLVMQLVQQAGDILTIIEAQNLVHMIDDELMSDLSLFGRIANKKSPAL